MKVLSFFGIKGGIAKTGFRANSAQRLQYACVTDRH